eukprot:9496336-Pyramimonas_sp.AAC.1
MEKAAGTPKKHDQVLRSCRRPTQQDGERALPLTCRGHSKKSANLDEAHPHSSRRRLAANIA